MLSKSVEAALGAPIRRMEVPTVEAVMEASRRRVLAQALAAAPGSGEESVAGGQDTDNVSEEQAVESFGAEDPRSQLADELLEALGTRRALEALVSAAFGNVLDPSRYAPIAEVPDRPRREGGLRDRPFGERSYGGRPFGGRSFNDRRDEGRMEDKGDRSGSARVYIGVGRHHGASARDVAGLLMRAGGVPGRFVDAVDVRDFCAFATLPAEAARRAVEFARRDPALPAIRPAAPVGERR